MSNITDSYVRDLDLNLLRTFVIVAEEGSLTRAATRLYVTQPAVSAAVRRLSTFLGAKLFARQGHGLVLTPRGAALLPVARTQLRELLAAALDVPTFDPARSTALVRLGLSGTLDTVLLPKIVARLRADAPRMQLVVLPVHFHSVAEQLLAGKVDLAVTVADDLPRSIRRRKIGPPPEDGMLCLYDPRHAKVTRTERSYLAQEHVVVSYAGDVRGIVEDARRKGRTVRVSVPAFSYVPDLVDGSNLVATVPRLFARHVLGLRPHLRAQPVPFPIARARLELLWARRTDSDAPNRFVRELVAKEAGSLDRREP